VVENVMRCEAIKKWLVAYLDGELTPDKRRLVEAHLSSCRQCRQELETLNKIQAEVRLALNMEADEVSPSPELWEKLQQRLENVRPSFRERWGGWMDKPLWRAVVPVMLVIMVIGTLWGTGVLPRFGGMSSPPPAPTVAAPTTTTAPTTAVPMPTPAPGISLGIMFDRMADIIGPYGEQIEIDLSFTNKASGPRMISWSTSEVRIIRLPDVQPPSIAVRSFPAETQQRLLQPDETATYEFVWDQCDANGQQLEPGWYGVEVALQYRNPSELNGGSIRGVPVRILVEPPGGVLEKAIDINQSLTVNDITFTLERIELTATGMKVYAFNTPPEYSLPAGQPGPAPSLWLHAEAEYSFDGGPFKQAFPSGINFLESGVQHTWGEYLDPAPKTAKALTFRITKLGDWAGPWEFEIPLQ